MPAAPSDMHIKARWIAPMTGDDLLEHHTLVMRDGRIAAILPDAAAALSYAPRVLLDRPAHLLIPGLVNAFTHIGSLRQDAGGHTSPGGRFRPEIGLLSIANMLKAGVTCFCDIGCFPGDAARTAASSGMRALIGLPVAEHPSPWAQNAGEYLTRALNLRDEYKGHPSISTGFAPLMPSELSDATLTRVSVLANELDAGVFVSLQQSMHDIDDSLNRHGLRPMARLEALGLLTPALTAAHAVHLSAADIDLARHAGIGITLCLASDLMRGNGLPPLAALAAPEPRAAESGAADIGAAGVGAADTRAASTRLGLGSDGGFCGPTQDLWTDIKLLALHARHAGPLSVLAAATRGGAQVLGLDAEIGTLEAGRWADVCCIDLGGPATQPLHDPVRQVVFSGGRDLVSDVWVSGRQLLCEGRFTRLDWPGLARHLGAER